MLSALVDIATDEGRLACALSAMRLAQCVVQARGPEDSPLMQLPGVERAAAKRITEALAAASSTLGTPPLLALAALKPKAAIELLRRVLPNQRAAEQAAAVACALPRVRVQWRVTSVDDDGAATDGAVHAEGGDGGASGKSGAAGGAPWAPLAPDHTCKLHVVLSAQDRAESKVHTPPQWSRPKTHAWWLLLSHPATDDILALKRVGSIPSGARRPCTHTLLFDAPECTGAHELVLRVVSDAAMGLDRELSVDVQVS